MLPLISIIVPIYNSELYLRECIDSVLSQTYEHIELLLIDDGSLDSSYTICEEMKLADARIRLFLMPSNEGVSAARNRGISEANGKYLFFMDSDDFIHPSLLESLYNILEKTHSTIAASGICSTNNPCAPQKEWGHILPETVQYTFLTNQESLNAFVRNTPFKELAGIGGKLIQTDTIQSIRFDNKLSHGEDTKFLYQLFSLGAKATILHQKWYYYRTHATQVTKNNSMKMYRSIYECQVFLRDQEEAAGRLENTIILEGKFLTSLALWYAESKRSGDTNCIHFLKKAEAKERSRSYYSQTALSARTSFFLAFHFTPLYWIIHHVWPYIEKLRK